MNPLKNWVNLERSMRFGQLYPRTPVFGELGGKPHLGVDIPVPVGTPILAPFSGLVTTRQGEDGGNEVILVSPGLTVWFFHCSKFGKTGNVRMGDIIGFSGGKKGADGSGTSTGPHVHVGASRTGKIEIDIKKLIDPDTLFYEPIKLSVLCSDFHDFEPMVDQFAQYGIQIEITQNFAEVTPLWIEGQINLQSLMEQYGSNANGHDIFIVIPKTWQCPDGQGYTDEKRGVYGGNLYGFEYCFVQESGEVNRPTSPFKFADPRIRIIAHELFHAFYKMAGKQDDLGNGQWAVHNLEDKGTILTANGVDFSKLPTRGKEEFYRLYKKTKQGLLERKVTSDLLMLFPSKLLYWKLFGFNQNI